MVATDGETGRGYDKNENSMYFMENGMSAHVLEQSLLGVVTRCSGCMVNGRITKASNNRVRTPPSPKTSIQSTLSSICKKVRLTSGS